MSRYQPDNIESKWQKYWSDNQVFKAEEDPEKPKYYVLSMFPYPSGSGLHMGHPLSYTAVDIVARYKKMMGFSVLNPMGWDSFGLPTERAAIRENRHPSIITTENITYFREQLDKLGFAFCWEREVTTSNVDYYRWTQWIFLILHEKGLAYLAEEPVNWCPAQGTVLANEEVVDGKYVETGDLVERRMMKQWMLKITAYAQRLLDDLDDLDWPAGMLEMQRQWIGRSEGAEVDFKVDGSELSFTVFTTRPDTLFGATYCVLAPENPLVNKITSDEQQEVVSTYIKAAMNRSDLERQVNSEKSKSGVWTGAYAINPVNNKRIPIWVADYVLMSYGTGAIMAVPAHDERDHSFAKKFSLPIVAVYKGPKEHNVQDEAWTGDGISINAGDFSGLDVEACKTAVSTWIEENGLGRRKINYKLRDWLFSRQRYWGEPFPIVHTEEGEIIPVPKADLPVSLPHIDNFRPTESGDPPLNRAKEWLHLQVDGKAATRETNTMPQWAGSCWYYLRFMDPNNSEAPFSEQAVNYWQNVDLYIGGVEHAVLHLLYARFWHKVLYDCGLVPTKEPFQKLFNQGMLLAESFRDLRGKYYSPIEIEERADTPVVLVPPSGNYKLSEALKNLEVFSHVSVSEPVQSQHFIKETGEPVFKIVEKMGKSKLNTVDPLEVVAEYGADTLRMYEMFMGPLEQVKPWQMRGCEGIFRFLSKVWRLFLNQDDGQNRPFGAHREPVYKALQVAIKEATLGIEQLKFNTPIAKMMEFINSCKGQLPPQEQALNFLLILSPYAPHITEELYSRCFDGTHSISECKWPAFDESALVESQIDLPVMVRGKMRGKVNVAVDASQSEVVAACESLSNIARHLEGKEIIRTIYKAGRMINFVVK
jgi:leucyl-tRNA synthetase